MSFTPRGHLSTNQVALIAGEPNPLRVASFMVDACDLGHIRPGSGASIRWETVDVLTLAFTFGLVEGDQVKRRYARYVPTARLAAQDYVRGRRPGWITQSRDGIDIWDADQADALAAWLMHNVARILRCAPILARLEAEMVTLGAGAASSSA